MKLYKIVYAVLLFCSTISNVTAEGLHSSGFVNIVHTDATSFLQASWSNRYDTMPSVSTSFITAFGGITGWNVTFIGRTTDGEQYFCAFAPGNPYYQDALNALHGLTNGTVISLWKDPDDWECKYFSVQQYSRYLD